MDNRKRRRNLYKKCWAKTKRATQRHESAEEADTRCVEPSPPNQSTIAEEISDGDEELNTSLTFELTQEGVIDDAGELSNNDDEVVYEGLASSLTKWAIDFNIKQNATDGLLKILRSLKSLEHENLPATARTLLKTEKNVEVQMVSGMEYVFLGVESGLRQHFSQYPDEVTQTTNDIEIALNIDGLPVFSSNNMSLWPILCAIHLEPIKVFAVAITYGPSKPSDLTFIVETVAEINNLLTNGFQYNDRTLNVKLTNVVCDAPAKAMVKKTKQFSGYYGCDRCDQRGSWDGKRITYTEVDNLQLRTDIDYRQKTQLAHHQNGPDSPFVNLPIDMIRAFPIDYMHCVCLGVTRRLILSWMNGKHRLSKTQLTEIDNRLKEMRLSIPCDFQRKPRPFSEVAHWKATEFRQFLLYTGKFILRGILDKQKYEHFMTFNVAMCILLSPYLLENHLVYARSLLAHFVRNGEVLYGQEFLVYNVHSLLHLADDAELYGGLDKCSAFPFENHLYQMKKLVRSGKRPVVQIVKRLGEVAAATQSKKCGLKNSHIKCRFPDNAYLLDDNETCVDILEEANKDANDGTVMYRCNIYRNPQPMFTRPCDSRVVGIYNFVHAADLINRVRLVPQSRLQQKLIKVHSEDNVIFSTILHS